MTSSPGAAIASSALALSTRLLLAITAAAFATLALSVWYIDRAMARGLIYAHEEGLEDHLKVLEQAIQADPEKLHAAEVVLQNTLGGDKNDKSYGCLTDPAGNSLLQTTGFSEFSPPLSQYPRPATVGHEEIRISRARHGGHPVFLAAAQVPRPGATEPLTYYFVADALPIEHFTQNLRMELLFVLLAGTVLSAGLAWIISHRGLRPISMITAEIEQTTANALQQPGADASPGTQTSRLPKEIARLSAAFAALRGRLSRSFHQLQQFSDDAAHEIRTPLSNMMGVASLTLQRERTPEEYRAALVNTLEECDRLRKLADGLLFISRADHRRSVLTCSSFDARTAITEVMDYHAEVAQDQGVTLILNASGNLTADRTLFRQALTNLLSNALRHTPTGGEIKVTYTPPGEAHPRSTLTVADTGEGIAPEHLPFILDRFFRVDSARTHQADAPPQTGLGLAIVKVIMDLHGGTVKVKSTLGRGTCVRLHWEAPAVKTDAAGPVPVFGSRP